MLYLLVNFLRDHLGPWGPWRVFRYPSFRMLGAALTALGVTLWLFPRCIGLLRQLQGGETLVREDTPQRHQQKHGTPTMGGVFILMAVTFSSLLWTDLTNAYLWAVLAVLLGFGGIGWVDDWRKLTYGTSHGLPGKRKLFWQAVVLLGVASALAAAQHGYLPFSGVQVDTRLSLPFVAVKWFHPDMGGWYGPFAFVVVMGTSHAVNLTDGLDGLAIGPTIVSAATFMILAYVAGLVLTFHVQDHWVDVNVASYLNIPYIEGSSELAVVCASIMGAGIGFLWFNTFPATVFMGDVGSLALGGALGTVAVLTKNEFLSALIHGVFLVEILSVITQVISFQLTGRRVFKMAPLHHHFELKGWAEPKIIVRFWIISIILAWVGLVSLKLR